MAMRAFFQVKKTCLINSLSRATFSSRSTSTVTYGQSPYSTGSWTSARTVAPLANYPPKKEMQSSPMSQIKRLFFAPLKHPLENITCNPSFRLASQNCGFSPKATQFLQSSPYSSTSGVYANVNVRFSKQRRNRGEMKGTTTNHLSFGKFALQALEPAWISSRQILAGQLAIKRNMRGGKSFIRVFPHKPISLRPAETRMGRGKGNVAFWVAGVRPGRILYEINGVSESVAQRAILVAASKMPIRTQFVRS